ncbi:hypothetical protein [Paenibacillus rubinfantis]|uniref:hypothetical protein n=1 Tax=Paenibacillus rubinfantis TaxID=1720296 RepID=UPI00073F0ED2|nr:hypothetical protein [Paenibacillus rubinfantis]
MKSFAEVWKNIIALEGSEFQQVRGQKFTYAISGEYVVPNTTNIRIPKSYFEKAWKQMPVSGPGALHKSLIAPSYLYPILSEQRSVGEAVS